MVKEKRGLTSTRRCAFIVMALPSFFVRQLFPLWNDFQFVIIRIDFWPNTTSIFVNLWLPFSWHTTLISKKSVYDDKGIKHCIRLNKFYLFIKPMWARSISILILPGSVQRVKEVSKNPSGIEGKKVIVWRKGTEKWISEREATEKTVSRAHVFLTGKSSGKSPRSKYPLLAKKLTTAAW